MLEILTKCLISYFSPTAVEGIVENMVGHRLVTKQTTSSGVLVRKVMVAEALDIVRETYLAILLDRGYNGPVIVGSSQGGMDIEEVAEKNPDAIFKVCRSYCGFSLENHLGGFI